LNSEEEYGRLEEHREVFPEVGEDAIDDVHLGGGYWGSWQCSVTDAEGCPVLPLYEDTERRCKS
jgi:hypothetical protein